MAVFFEFFFITKVLSATNAQCTGIERTGVYVCLGASDNSVNIKKNMNNIKKYKIFRNAVH